MDDSVTRAQGRLRGARVVVTRPPDRAGPLVAALRAEGAQVVPVPMIEAAPPADPGPLADAAHRLATAPEGAEGAEGARFDLVVFTSVYAVRALSDALGGRAPPPGLPAACVGPSTAAAAEAAGWRVEVVAERYSAAGLLAALDARTVDPAGGAARLRGLRVLYPRAADARETLARGLRGRGADVHEVEAYRKTTPTVPAYRPRAADVLTFTSPSTVRNFFDAFDGAAARAAPAAVIGPTTAAAYRERTGGSAAVAPEASVEGLVEAAVSAWRGRRN